MQRVARWPNDIVQNTAGEVQPDAVSVSRDVDHGRRSVWLNGRVFASTVPIDLSTAIEQKASLAESLLRSVRRETVL